MVTVAALGFGNIPTNAFIEAFNIITAEGWVAFNIKETFFDKSDKTGFSSMIRELIFSEYLHIYTSNVIDIDCQLEVNLYIILQLLDVKMPMSSPH